MSGTTIPMIWAVDDSPLEGELVKRTLADRYRVELFAEGEAMLDRLSSAAGPDVLVLDWHLPGVSGVEICELIRAKTDELALPILLMTASQRAGSDVVRGLLAGANDYVRKPYEPAELLARVGTLVRIKQLHARLEAARAENEVNKHAMQQRIEFEEQLIGIVSHDLRNPLQAIMTSASSLLRSEGLDERNLERLGRILSGAERANRMIRDLLDFTQARLGGAIPLTRKQVDLSGVARQVVDEILLVSPERCIQIETFGDGHGSMDADRIAQVISNLVGNAVKYSPTDSPITVRVRGTEGELELHVHNAGPPIPPELLPRLFEPFQRGASSDPAGRSIGLGLYIVREIIASHGGRVEVRSEPGEGTTFTLRLPRRVGQG